MKCNSVFTVRSLTDIEDLKYSTATFEKIIIETEKIRAQSIFRYIFKYALYRVKINGTIKVVDEPFKDYAYSNIRLDFWQVKYELFKSIGEFIEVLEIDPIGGIISCKKKVEYNNHNGISFGIVYSGLNAELEQLFNSIDSIVRECSEQQNYEILICGPTNINKAAILEKYDCCKVIYLEFDVKYDNGRLMIGEKKNYIFSQSKYSIVVISHTRIIFSYHFFERLINYSFDFITPLVRTNTGKKYICYALIDSYDMGKVAFLPAIPGSWLPEFFLPLVKRRFPLIDGGINIFNKNVVKSPPYNNYFAWGEAEDTEVCSRLYFNGILIDINKRLECLSQTNKANTKKSIFKNIFNIKLFYLIFKIKWVEIMHHTKKQIKEYFILRKSFLQ